MNYFFVEHKYRFIKPLYKFFRVTYVTSIIVILFSSVIFAQEIKTNNAIVDSLKQKDVVADSIKNKTHKTVTTHFKSSSLLPQYLSDFRIHKTQLEATDHKTTNGFLSNAPLSFTKNLGYTGLPSEILLYGSSLTYFDEGIELSNRITNSFDLNSFQSESVDSIEIIPLSRSFLFGNSSTAAINFIQREPIKSKPYSRIKYYQAPNDEAFIDGIFSITPIAKTNVYFEITNQSNGALYKTTLRSLSDYTNWMGNLRVNYAFSDKSNLRFTYKYVNSTIQLYGGVDVDSIRNSFALSNLSNILYDNILSPVRYSNRYSNNVVNNLSLNAKIKLVPNLFSEVTIYSNNSLLSFRQNISGDIQDGILPISRDNNSKTTGIKLSGEYSDSLFNVGSNALFENTNFGIDQYSQVYSLDSARIDYYNGKTLNNFSITANASLNLFDKKFIPAGFVKYLQTNNKSYFGFGADAVLKINDGFKIYGGISRFEKPTLAFTKNQSGFIAQNISQKINSFEARAFYTSKMIDVSVGYFFTQNDNEIFYAFDESTSKNDVVYSLFTKQSQNSGANLSLSINLWKLNFSTNASYYFSEEDRILKGLPAFTLRAGAFYIDTLFNNNLKLKAGFNIYGYGSRYRQQIDFEKGVSSSYYFTPQQTNGYSSVSFISNEVYSPAAQVDLFIAGKIQDAATIYFTWENVLNTKYMIVPYYPMQLRNIRFGFSWEFFD